MYWANFLHIYQPYGQQPDILEAVVAQSYRPLIQGLLKNPDSALTLNVTGALLDLFDQHGYFDLIDGLRQLAGTGRVELTSSAKYHTLLPFLDADDIMHQIKINNETLQYYLGSTHAFQGFFPPEMAYHPKLVPILEELGFKWVIVDEIAFNGQVGQIKYDQTYTIKGSKLKVFFREHRLSNLVMSAAVRTSESLKEIMEPELASDRYVVTGMDGETFGHHRPGLENLLFEIFTDPTFKLVNISQLVELFPKSTEVTPVTCTWASSPVDIEKGIQFISWSDPANPIHTAQWNLFKLTKREFAKLDSATPNFTELRKQFDVACASDHFFWASANPWWSVEMIEEGAYRLLSVVQNTPGVDQSSLDQAKAYYEEIISTAFEWQRSNKIRQIALAQKDNQRIPFKERTLGVGGEQATVYHAFIDLLRSQEEKAASKHEYEAATMWRDAIYKLENKSDIYDAVHVIDLLRIQMPSEEIEKVIEKYKLAYRKIRGGQPEQRDK